MNPNEKYNKFFAFSDDQRLIRKTPPPVVATPEQLQELEASIWMGVIDGDEQCDVVEEFLAFIEKAYISTSGVGVVVNLSNGVRTVTMSKNNSKTDFKDAVDSALRYFWEEMEWRPYTLSVMFSNMTLN